MGGWCYLRIVCFDLQWWTSGDGGEDEALELWSCGYFSFDASLAWME